jgi:hypothetical protein
MPDELRVGAERLQRPVGIPVVVRPGELDDGDFGLGLA